MIEPIRIFSVEWYHDGGSVETPTGRYSKLVNVRSWKSDALVLEKVSHFWQSPEVWFPLSLTLGPHMQQVGACQLLYSSHLPVQSLFCLSAVCLAHCSTSEVLANSSIYRWVMKSHIWSNSHNYQSNLVVEQNRKYLAALRIFWQWLACVASHQWDPPANFKSFVCPCSQITFQGSCAPKFPPKNTRLNSAQ